MDRIKACTYGDYAERMPAVRVAYVRHVGPYEKVGETIGMIEAFMAENGLQPGGRHHAIYLSDPRRVPPERLKTIVRTPVK